MSILYCNCLFISKDRRIQEGLHLLWIKFRYAGSVLEVGLQCTEIIFFPAGIDIVESFLRNVTMI